MYVILDNSVYSVNELQSFNSEGFAGGRKHVFQSRDSETQIMFGCYSWHGRPC